MSINVALQQLLEAEQKLQRNGIVDKSVVFCFVFLNVVLTPTQTSTALYLTISVINENTKVIGTARVGTATQQIVAGTISQLYVSMKKRRRKNKNC